MHIVVTFYIDFITVPWLYMLNPRHSTPLEFSILKMFWLYIFTCLSDSDSLYLCLSVCLWFCFDLCLLFDESCIYYTHMGLNSVSWSLMFLCVSNFLPSEKASSFPKFCRNFVLQWQILWTLWNWIYYQVTPQICLLAKWHHSLSAEWQHRSVYQSAKWYTTVYQLSDNTKSAAHLPSWSSAVSNVCYPPFYWELTLT